MSLVRLINTRNNNNNNNNVHSGQQLGTDLLLPYLSPQLTGQKLLVGANFASAGIGILNDTGVQFVSLTSISIYIARPIS